MPVRVQAVQQHPQREPLGQLLSGPTDHLAVETHRLSRGVLQQRRLPDTGLALDPQPPTTAMRQRGHQPLDRVPLLLAADRGLSHLASLFTPADAGKVTVRG